MRSRIAPLILMVGLCSAAALAQAPSNGDFGGSESTLIVRLTYENGRSAPGNLRVELISAFGGAVATATTSGMGSASVTFQHVGAGKYKLQVTELDGSHIDSDIFDVVRNEAMHTEFMHLAREAPQQKSATEPTVAASDMNVPDKAKKEFTKGNESLETKSWADAKDHFERAIELYPQYAAAHSSLGIAYASLGQGAKAVAAFQKALKLDEHQTAANIYLGQFYYDNQKFAEAAPYLERAAAAEPENPQLLTALANAELKTGKLDAALANARKVHSIPDHQKFAAAHIIAAQILNSRGRKETTMEEYRLFLKEDPQSQFAPRVRDALAKLESAPQ